MFRMHFEKLDRVEKVESFKDKKRSIADCPLAKLAEQYFREHPEMDPSYCDQSIVKVCEN